MMVRVVLFLSVIFMTVSCRIVREKQMLKKAVEQGIPETSKWVGHKDGGVWVNFVFGQDSVFHIDTYNDYTNEFGSRFTYKVVCASIEEKEIKKAFKHTGVKEVTWKKESKVYPCLEFIEKKTNK